MTGDNRTPDRVDDVFVQLSHPRRRAIMLLVAAAGGRGVDLRTVSAVLYALEEDVRPTDAPTRPVTNLRTNIKRSHLPQLTASGLIEFNEERLAAGPAFGVALEVLLSAGYWLGTAQSQFKEDRQNTEETE